MLDGYTTSSLKLYPLASKMSNNGAWFVSVFCCADTHVVLLNQYAFPCSVCPDNTTTVVLVATSGWVRLAGCRSIISPAPRSTNVTV